MFSRMLFPDVIFVDATLLNKFCVACFEIEFANLFNCFFPAKYSCVEFHYALYVCNSYSNEML